MFVYLVYATAARSEHGFLTWSHIPSGRGDVGVLVHLLTYSLLRSTLFFAWLYIPLTSFMLHYSCLLYMITVGVLSEKWEDKMVARSQLAHRRWTNVGITVKISFQSRTNFWMLRYGTTSTNGNGDTIIAMPCGKWCPRLWKNFAHEMLHLQMRKVKGSSSLRAAVHCLWLYGFKV